MRVLHVTDAYLPRLGGIELHVHDLARAQIAAGDEVDVLTVTRGRGSPTADPIEVIRPHDRANPLEKWNFMRANRLLGSQAGYDVVHAHCSTVSLMAFHVMAEGESVPTVITVHSLWRRYTPLYRFFDHTLDWSNWPIRYSAVSNVAADSIRRCAKGPIDVTVLPNGIDLDVWSGGDHTPEPGHLRMLSVMRLSPRKRPIALLRMLRRVRAELPASFRLSATVIGEGPERHAMERYLRRHGMSGWVSLPGHLPRPEIARAMSRADVFVAPAILESFGIAALEARAAGLPVVGRRNTGLQEFVTSPADGRLVDTDAGMVRALVELAQDESARARSAPSATIAEMAWPAVVQRTREAYLDVGASTSSGQRAAAARRQAS